MATLPQATGGFNRCGCAMSVHGPCDLAGSAIACAGKRAPTGGPASAIRTALSPPGCGRKAGPITDRDQAGSEVTLHASYSVILDRLQQRLAVRSRHGRRRAGCAIRHSLPLRSSIGRPDATCYAISNRRMTFNKRQMRREDRSDSDRSGSAGRLDGLGSESEGHEGGRTRRVRDVAGRPARSAARSQGARSAALDHDSWWRDPDASMDRGLPHQDVTGRQPGPSPRTVRAAGRRILDRAATAAAPSRPEWPTARGPSRDLHGCAGIPADPAPMRPVGSAIPWRSMPSGRTPRPSWTNGLPPKRHARANKCASKT